MSLSRVLARPAFRGLLLGQLVSIASAPELFSVIGTAYGGDGDTNFRVPDLRGRALAGRGTGVGLTPRELGEAFGAETVTQNLFQVPVHAHPVTRGSTEPTGGGQTLPTVQPTLAIQPVITHLGAALNFAAGTLRRAPAWMQAAGLEWLWRIREEPALWRRYARQRIGEECRFRIRDSSDVRGPSCQRP